MDDGPKSDAAGKYKVTLLAGDRIVHSCLAERYSNSSGSLMYWEKVGGRILLREWYGCYWVQEK